MFADYTGVADDAFNAAKKHFEQSGILNGGDKVLVSSASSIEDVQQAVADLLAKYESKSESSKTRKWLQKASEMISHYGTILDVFVQHHPEYVSLVWGTMKLLFIVSILSYDEHQGHYISSTNWPERAS
jgi:hypothetical protein